MKKLLTFFLTALLAFSVGWAAEVTFDSSILSGITISNQSVTSNGITVAFTKNNSNNTDYWDGSKIRFYTSNTMTISSSSTITNIVITCTAQNIASNGPSHLSASPGSYSYSGYDGTWTGSANSVTFTATAQTRFTKIVVTTSGGTVETCKKPTISLPSGTYSGEQTVTITSETSGATIYYTTDGNNPTTSSNYISNGGSVTIDQTCTLKAMAVKSGMNNSDVATAEYVITTGAGNIYKKVKDANQLVDGKKYIIVYEDGNRFLGSINKSGSTHYGNQIQGPIINSGTVDIAGYSDVCELILTKDGNHLSFNNGSGYLKWSAGNSLDEESSITDNSRWTASGSQNSGYQLTNVYNTDRVLKYNSSSPRFACYESGQQSAVLYVKDSEDPTLTVTPPASLELTDIPYNAAAGAVTTTTFTVAGAHLTGDVTVSINGADFSVSPTTLTRDVNGSISETAQPTT